MPLLVASAQFNRVVTGKEGAVVTGDEFTSAEAQKAKQRRYARTRGLRSLEGSQVNSPEGQVGDSHPDLLSALSA